MMGKLAGKLITAAVGVALFVLWMQFSDSSGTLDDASFVPPVVFEGGGGTLEVQFTTNQPAGFAFGFERYDEAADDVRSVGGTESFAPGTHSRTIDVSAATYIYLELGVPDASPGGRAELGHPHRRAGRAEGVGSPGRAAPLRLRVLPPGRSRRHRPGARLALTAPPRRVPGTAMGVVSDGPGVRRLPRVRRRLARHCAVPSLRERSGAPPGAAPNPSGARSMTSRRTFVRAASGAALGTLAAPRILTGAVCVHGLGFRRVCMVGGVVGGGAGMQTL